jgi:uroporphyrinogen III methyltransferase / synthase
MLLYISTTAFLGLEEPHIMPQHEDSVQPSSSRNGVENRPELPEVAQMGNLKCSGKVFLVGGGPGDPRLITLRGMQCLQQADVVLFDGLANPCLLNHARQAEKISVGKHGMVPIWTQSQINQRLVELAMQGKKVVRLKGGDPAVFGRTAEELEALQQHQIEFEVVPGITAALAVAGYTGIPLTHRNHASAVALVTGQQHEDAPEMLDWPALAKFPGTLIVYMGVTTAQQWTRDLLDAGKSPQTPCAIVRRCTWSDQLVIRCRLDEVAELLTPASKLRPPVLTIVGEVAAMGADLSWFERLPLQGVGIWLPRTEQQSIPMQQSLEELGAQVFIEPVIDTQLPKDSGQLALAIELLKIKRLDGITFSSVNGVNNFCNYLRSSGLDSRAFAGVQLAAVGPAVAEELLRYGLRADIVPTENYSASGLLNAMQGKVQHQRWLVTTTNHSSDTLTVGLRQLHADVQECLCYETIESQSLSDELLNCIENSTIEFVAITSGSIARIVHRLLVESMSSAAKSKRSNFFSLQPIAMGNQAAEVLNSLRWPAAATSTKNTTESLIEALVSLTTKPKVEL